MTDTLVIGGTGAMGGRIVRRLLERADATVAVFTRDPRSRRATELLAHGGGRVRMLQGDLDDSASVLAAVSSVDRVFCNTDFFTTGTPVGEYNQGLAILEAARGSGVDRFIWSSLDSAVTLTNGTVPVPHYDAKGAVAARINLLRSDEMMRLETDGWYTEHVSVLTTAPYFENLQLRLAPQPHLLPDGRAGLMFSLPLGTGEYPMVGLDDIAWFADFMFENWQSWGSRDLAVVGDSLSGAQIAATFERVTGTPSAYTPLPLDILRSSIPDKGHDFAAMFQFFQERKVADRDRDRALLAEIHPHLMTFEDWLRTTGWDGTETDVQKFPIRLAHPASTASGTGRIASAGQHERR
ncbi:NmrA family NAD(P)-binding protein [Amycolatopsis sp. NPDC059027]|uniref:NmrA family NAD(P)-binding protein n=1 Tax=unclassified Amycolatopsis TaxID=2618356 RepID=UPI003672B3F0